MYNSCVTKVVKGEGVLLLVTRVIMPYAIRVKAYEKRSVRVRPKKNQGMKVKQRMGQKHTNTIKHTAPRHAPGKD